MLTWSVEFLRDIRIGIRHLAKSPGVTSISVLSLALGIMATTAIYSVIHAVVLDPFPYKDVDNLMSVRVWGAGQQGFRTYYSTDQFLEIAEGSTIFEGTIASTISDVLWVDGAEPQRLRGNYGTFNTFQVMGVQPLLGRTTLPDDARPDAAPVVVLGYRFWQRQFGGDPGVIGRQLRLNDKIRTVIGVMPKRFMWRGADVYLPITFERGRVVEGVRFVHLLGRLKPGITEAQAEVDLRPIIDDLKKKEPARFPDNSRVGLLSFKETFPSSIRENLWILFGAVGLLLLIACANVSNLLLSKASERQKEMAVRAALGASRSRLIRQLLTESLLIAVGGGALGVALAFGCLRAILAIVPPNTIPDESEIALNTQVLLFTVLVSVLTSIIFGLAPALHTSTSDLANPLRESGRGLQGGSRQALLRKGLVIAEVALSLMLLVGAGLMMRTFIAVQDVELGFRTDRLLTVRIPLPDKRYPDRERRIAFFQDLLRRVSSVPGVQSVGLNSGVHPFGYFSAPVDVVGSSQQDSRRVVIHQINAEYPKALGIPLVAGRLFSESEVSGVRHLALVNQSFVRGRLDGREALGRVIRIPRLKEPAIGATDDSFEIVGVLKDTLNRGLTEEVVPEVYLPFTVTGLADNLVALTQVEPAGITKAVMSQVYSIDKDQPVTDVSTIERALQEGVYAGPRFNLALFGVFAALGLTLAAIGVYGVMSSSVAQQKHEIGVRMALGASPANISGMVVKRGAWLMLIGIAVGMAGSLMMARLLTRQIWNVSPFDPITFISVSLILLVAGLQACLWPARRAARIDPIAALRQE
jgi:putative ABC transport system permease protein